MYDMCLIAKVIRISYAKFHCNRLTTVQDVQDYASLIFWDTVYIVDTCMLRKFGDPCGRGHMQMAIDNSIHKVGGLVGECSF